MHFARSKRRTSAALLVVAALAALAFFLLRPSARARQTALLRAPDSLITQTRRRRLPLLSGAALDPPPAQLSLYAPDGRPQLIDVWASWCIPCKEEAPMLAALHRTYDKRMRFLGIDVEDTRGGARAFERHYRLGYPSIFDQHAAMADKLNFYGLPTAYLVDRRGRLAAVLIGKQTKATLQAKLVRLLREQSRKNEPKRAR